MNANRHSTLLDTGLLVLRAAIALVFIYHGAQKLLGAWGGPGLSGFAGWLGSMHIPAPFLSATLAACSEFIGGIAVLLGIYARTAAVPMIFTMGVAVSVKMSKGFSVLNGGIEFPLVMGLLLVALTFTGSGQFSLDRLWRRERVAPWSSAASNVAVA